MDALHQHLKRLTVEAFPPDVPVVVMAFLDLAIMMIMMDEAMNDTLAPDI